MAAFQLGKKSLKDNLVSGISLKTLNNYLRAYMSCNVVNFESIIVLTTPIRVGYVAVAALVTFSFSYLRVGGPLLWLNHATRLIFKQQCFFENVCRDAFCQLAILVCLLSGPNHPYLLLQCI